MDQLRLSIDWSRGIRAASLFAIMFVCIDAPGDDRAEQNRGGADPFRFRDAAEAAGLLPDVAGIRGHGCGWGDVDGDGWVDLYVAAFHTGGSQKANLFFRNRGGMFELDEQPVLRISQRPTGVVFADFDNDGDLDLYIASMPAGPGSRLAEREGHVIAGCSLLRNDGAGRFTNVSEGNGACPQDFGGRSAAVLDFDGDALLDLLVGEDPVAGYNGSETTSSRLFRNLGEMEFADVSRSVGLSEGIPGLGVAAADVNNDSWPDFLLASTRGNRLFLNDGRGAFSEAPGARDVFAWPTARGDNMVCGVCFGDVNRDGLLDVVLGQHYERPWQEPIANRLYLNRGIVDGVPHFEDVTDQAGLVPLPMKAPHVEIQDFDNDGWPEILTSIVKFADGRPHPVIFRNLGSREGLPRFSVPALHVNEFPTADDRALRRSGPLFERILRDRTIIYTAPGPTADYDNDGRLDFFLPNWFEESPSMLLRNETSGGHWLQVQVDGPDGVNRMGIGTRINVYPAGMLGDETALFAAREMAVGFGYASGQPAIAHFGLGELTRIDLQMVFPHGKGTLVRHNLPVDRRITIAK